MSAFTKEAMNAYYNRDADSLSHILERKENSMQKSTVLSIARVAHEVNRAYCQAIGDHSQTAWEDAPNWQRDSACKGVQVALDNPAITASDMHRVWMEQKVKEGWVFGEVKDPNAKTHPCLVPYDQLPEPQRIKDHLFKGVVHAIAREMARPA